MLWNVPPAVRIYVATAPTDMRKSFDGLSAAVSHVLAQDPFAGHLFVFFNRGADRVRSDPVLGRTWGLRGQTPEVPTSGRRQSVSAIRSEEHTSELQSR